MKENFFISLGLCVDLKATACFMSSVRLKGLTFTHKLYVECFRQVQVQFYYLNIGVVCK